MRFLPCVQFGKVPVQTGLWSLLILLSSISFAQQRGGQPLPSEKELDISETYAVVVGISDYQDPDIPDLKYADKDAQAFANFLRSPAGGGLDPDHLKVLINDEATGSKVSSILYWLLEVCGPNDRALIYFSGHGDVETKFLKQPGFLLCWDAPSEVYMAGGVLDLRLLQDVISALSEQNKSKVIVIADACRSGKLSGSAIGGAQVTTASLMQQYSNEIKILSCQPDEYSLEGLQWGNGRGVFSYHLINGLYGLADRNQDSFVTLMEIQRYLQEKVSEEVTPLVQIPLTIGNFTERLFAIDTTMLARIEEEKSNQLLVFTPTETRGIEERVLSKVDSSVRNSYNAFYRALDENRFFYPEGDCAEYYYTQLSKHQSLAPLHSALRRNYSAALQDDAQQAINRWLNDPNEKLESSFAKREKFADYPQNLDRAAELLGEDHYMHSIIMARSELFKGVLILESNKWPDEAEGRRAINHLKKSLKLFPNQPYAFTALATAYGAKMQDPDSLEFYTDKAIESQPKWIRPYINIVGPMSMHCGQPERAKKYLTKATEMDSTNIGVWGSWATYYMVLGDHEASVRSSLKALAIDSNDRYVNQSLGAAYMGKGNLDKANKYILRVIELESVPSGKAYMYFHLGRANKDGDRLQDAETFFQMALKLDPETAKDVYFHLACIASRENNLDKGFDLLSKALQNGYDQYDEILESTELTNLREEKEQWDSLIETYLPDKIKN